MQCLLKLALVLSAFSTVLCGNTFILGSNPNQVFDNVNVGPYPGTLDGSSTYFFCLDFNRTATFGGTYTGTVANPVTEQEKEAALLGAFALYMGSPSSNAAILNSVEGPISFAIWQIMGTLGNTAPLPAAQSYVQVAQYAFTHSLIPQSYLSNVWIFTPSNPSIQRFFSASAADPSLFSAVPEPGTTALLAGGLLILAWWKVRRRPVLSATEARA